MIALNFNDVGDIVLEKNNFLIDSEINDGNLSDEDRVDIDDAEEDSL